MASYFPPAEKVAAAKKRAVTSAVPGMSVPEMRKHLADVRHRLAWQNETAPFSLNDELAPGMPAWRFVHAVAVGLHRKRTSSRAREKAAKEGEEGDDDDEE